MKIAVIGTGISGLVTAYLLQQRHEVHLFEANNYVGGHTNTVRVELEGEIHHIDTGFIVCNNWTYPNFLGFLDELGVNTQPTSMGFSVRCDRCGLEYSGGDPVARMRNFLRVDYYQMMYDILRFNRQARLLPDDITDQQTVGSFLQAGRYSASFLEHYLLPMGAAIWSCPMAAFKEFPVRFIAEFYRNHGLLNITDRPTWSVVQGGSKSYVTRILSMLTRAPRLSCPVNRISRTEDSVELSHRAGSEQFDEVVLACHSDQALEIIAHPSPAETEVLQAFPYSQNTAVLHYDELLLPRSRRVWSSWNYHVRSEEVRPSVTYNMNILQGLSSSRTYCVTLNETDSIRPERVLGTYHYSHPLFTIERAAAQQRHPSLIRHRRTSYCGAYWGNGFHESGVVSALRVCEAYGIVPNWSVMPIQPGPAEEESLAC